MPGGNGSRKAAGTVCLCGEERAAAGVHDGAGPGTRCGDRRAVAHRHWRGYHDLADRAGRAARMIQLPASVRMYLCLTPRDMRNESVIHDKKSQEGSGRYPG
jgi:hypothetical protein